VGDNHHPATCWLTTSAKASRTVPPIPIDAGTSPEEDSLTLADQLEDRRLRPDEVQKKRQVAEMVHQGLQKALPRTSEALILRDLQDMDYREIATALKVPEGTVKSRINRGRAKLARFAFTYI